MARAFGRPRTKIFNHKRYSLVSGFSIKRDANSKAAEIRRNGHLARVTQEINDLRETKYAVWSK